MAPILRRQHPSPPSPRPRGAAPDPRDPPRWPRLIVDVARAVTAIAVTVAVIIDRFF